MARLETTNTPDFQSLLIPQHAIMLAVEQVILRGHKWSHATAEQIAVRIDEQNGVAVKAPFDPRVATETANDPLQRLRSLGPNAFADRSRQHRSFNS